MKRVDELDKLKGDVAELARAINTQAALLNAIVRAHDYVVKSYMEITKVEEKPNETKVEKPK